MPTEEGTSIVVRLDDLLHQRSMTLTELADRVGLPDTFRLNVLTASSPDRTQRV